MVRPVRSLVLLVQRMLDPLLVALALPLVCASSGEAFDERHQLMALFGFVTSAWILGAAGLYRSDGPRRLGARIALGWAAVGALLAARAWLADVDDRVSLDVRVAWGLAALLLLGASCLAARVAARSLRVPATGVRKAVVVGAGRAARDLAHRIAADPTSGIDIVGFFDEIDVSARRRGLRILGRTSDVAGYVKTNGIGHVFVTPRGGEEARLIEELADTTASVSLLLPLPAQAAAGDLEEVAGVPLVTVCETPFADWSMRLIKRLSDFFLAGIGLLVAAPVMAIVALAVKLTSAGPVLFRQRRHGLDGEEIVVYKFRTMTVMEDGDRVDQAQRNDPRVTRVGAFLRKSSLDELPQLINVLQGRMSMIGPRPHALAHNEHYRRLIGGYMRRHKVKPGLSGWAQVNGFRGETRTVDEMRARVEHDLYYLRNWSLWLDLRILFMTVFAVIRASKAY